MKLTDSLYSTALHTDIIRYPVLGNPQKFITAKMEDATCNMTTNVVSLTRKTPRNMCHTMAKSCSS